MKKMVDRNPHTGAKLQSKLPSEDFSKNYDFIFKPKLKPYNEMHPLNDGMTFARFNKLSGMGWLDDSNYFYGVEGEGTSKVVVRKDVEITKDNSPSWANYIYGEDHA